jgi:PHD/YefM family antitoxin component YafN of YafNO toxin-antitoxin module
MIDLTKGIESLTSFKRDTSRYLTQLQETGQPLVLTINGKAALIVQDVAS